MNKLWLILLVGFLFVGCDKVKKTQKTLTGVWTVIQYKKTLATGLAYFYDSEGTLSFGSCDGELCDYSLKINYQDQGTTLQKHESGTIALQDDEYFFLHRNNPDGTVTLLDEGRIILMTKDDLKIEFHDEVGIHEFVFQK